MSVRSVGVRSVGIRTHRSAASARVMAFAATLIAIVPAVVVATPASAYWSAASSPTSAGVASAASVNAGSTPTATVANKNQVTITWAATTLSNGIAVSGYTVARFNQAGAAQTMLSTCTGVVAATTCTETSVPNGVWTYRVTPVFGTNWKGTQGAASTAVIADALSPVNAVSLIPQVNVFRNGTTIWVRTSAGAGSLKLSNAVTDTLSGPASSASTITGTIGGFSHTPSTVTTPSGGPYVSGQYSWTLNATGTPSARIVSRDAYGNTATTTIPIRPDNTAPTGGAISYPGGLTGQTTQQVSLASIADSQSGLGAGTRYLQESTAALTGTACGTFGSFTTVVINPAILPAKQPVSLRNGTCYRYQYLFTDSVGNPTTTTDAANTIIKVRTFESTVLETPGNVSYWTLDNNDGTIGDAAGTNSGQFFNGPTYGDPGAIPASGGTSVRFDGNDDYGRVTRQIQDDFSIELWFRSTQGLGNTGRWYNGAGLVDAEVPSVTNDFGVSLMADGRISAGTGNPDTFVNSPAGLNDGNWHHVVFTRTRSTGALVLYVDGVQVASATGGLQSLDMNANIEFGRIQSGNGNGVNYFQGNLDNIAVYDVALNAATVADHYQVGKLP